jgi:uroporphyrinogen decarboxylase
MPENMTHGERVHATLRGEEVDRPPVSMWRHHFADERTVEGLAEATLTFQRDSDWDFVKVNPRATYHAEVFGMPFTLRDDNHPDVVDTLVKEPEDWRKIQPLGLDQPVLADHLRALELIMAGTRDDTPILMTVFNPISIAARFTPSGRLFAQHLRENFDEVAPALEAITETFVRFGRACLERGASGLFLATTAWASRRRLTEDEYARFAKPFELKVLDAVSQGSFNILHVCQDQNMLRAVSDYPVHAFNWDALGTDNPSLVEGKNLIGDRPVIGGIPHEAALAASTPGEIASAVSGLKAAMGQRGWIAGPGCTFDGSTPAANLKALRDAIARTN